MNEKNPKFPDVTEARLSDGGQAFPVQANGYAVLGMTLRDFLAAMATAAIISKVPSKKIKDGTDIEYDNEVARGGYAYADAMLRVRGEA